MKDGKHLVLCVDDDVDLLDSLKLILESNGFEVVQAESAEAGFEKFMETGPDLVIVDLMMEEVDAGTNFVTKIRALGKTTPIYMLSSVGDNLNLNVDYSQLGVAGILQKPVNPDVLVKTLKSKLK